MDITREEQQRDEFRGILLELSESQLSLKEKGDRSRVYQRLEKLYYAPAGQEGLLGYIVTVQTGHLLAPEKRRGQEVAGVSHMSNLMTKRLCKQKQACNTLSHEICRPSELLQYIRGSDSDSVRDKAGKH